MGSFWGTWEETGELGTVLGLTPLTEHFLHQGAVCFHGASAPIDDKTSSIQLRREGSLFFSSIF
jgi:hypothetical protein